MPGRTVLDRRPRQVSTKGGPGAAAERRVNLKRDPDAVSALRQNLLQLVRDRR